MIIGIGTDIVEVERIRRAMENPRFVEKVFTPAEIDHCGKNFGSYAGRWAAKEAVMKAFGTGFAGGSFTDIEILNDVRGKPEINLTGNFKKLAENIGVKNFFISISHEKNFATAVCILEI